MSERDPRFGKFSARVNGMSVSWSSKEPHLTGDQVLIDLILEELRVNEGYKVTATGPYVYSDVRKAAPVFLALLDMFGDSVAFKNPPNLDRFWLRPDMLDGFGNLRDDLVF
jgi:hypothetical protein